MQQSFLSYSFFFQIQTSKNIDKIYSIIAKMTEIIIVELAQYLFSSIKAPQKHSLCDGDSGKL